MNRRELFKCSILGQVLAGRLTNRQASLKLNLHIRQIQRLKKRYSIGGSAAIVHRSRGRPSGRAIPSELKDTISKLLFSRYSDFGATFAAEKLQEEFDITVSVEWLRKLQVELGLRKVKKRRSNSRFHPRRTRRPRRGELVQIDGSDHLWFEDRAPRCTLLSFIDDATSEVLFARFVPSESYQSYAEAMRDFFKNEGLPAAFYSDKHGVFWQTNKDARERGKLTTLGRNLKELKVEMICANSPQAKGRIERSFGTHQDRLVKEMRLTGIDDVESGNLFLESYLRKHNRKFSVPPAARESAFTPLDKGLDLNKARGRHETRKLSKDLSFQHERTLYQAINVKLPRRAAGSEVRIMKTVDGELEFTLGGKPLEVVPYCEYSSPQPTMDAKDISTATFGGKGHKPKRQHPWR